MADTKAIRARLEAACGLEPRFYLVKETTPSGYPRFDILDAPPDDCCANSVAEPYDIERAEFLTAAPADITDLLDALDERDREITRLQSELVDVSEELESTETDLGEATDKLNAYRVAWDHLRETFVPLLPGADPDEHEGLAYIDALAEQVRQIGQDAVDARKALADERERHKKLVDAARNCVSANGWEADRTYMGTCHIPAGYVWTLRDALNALTKPA